MTIIIKTILNFISLLLKIQLQNHAWRYDDWLLAKSAKMLYSKKIVEVLFNDAIHVVHKNIIHSA